MFTFIFGRDFATIKQLLFLLIPGIISIAISNVYGHYFAGTNRMKVLIEKSLLGLVITLGLSMILIPIWNIKGACMVTSLSYLGSSVYLMYKFYIPNKPSNATVKGL